MSRLRLRMRSPKPRTRLQSELRASGGRTNIRDLQAIINIDSSHIQHHVEAIVEADERVQLLPGGEVVTETYLDTVAEDVNVELQRRGQMTIGDIATTYQLPVKVVRTCHQSI